MDELKPCPFCGKPAEFDGPSVYSGAPVFQIRCCIADTRMKFTRDAAIAAWNRRTSEARDDE